MAGAEAKKSGLGRQGACGLTALLFCLCFPALQAQDTVPNLTNICGRNNLSPKIYGGSDAEPERWPWQVALLLQGRFICGGALIDSNWVASAAHCFQRSLKPVDYQILIGYNELSNPTDVSLQMTVHKVIVHPNFNKDHYLGNDITLMQLDRPVKFNAHVQPVCLPDNSIKLDFSTSCWISGWGMVTEQKFLPAPLKLQEAEVYMINRSYCMDAHSHAQPVGINAKPVRVLDDAVCAMGAMNDKSICRGDSGGPLVCPVEGIWYLIGLSSWSQPCEPVPAPSVFANVNHFTKWIKTKKSESPTPDIKDAPPIGKPPSLSPGSSCDPVLKPRMTALLSAQFLLLWLILVSAQ